eukprot:s3076_g5.t1
MTSVSFKSGTKRYLPRQESVISGHCTRKFNAGSLLLRRSSGGWVRVLLCHLDFWLGAVVMQISCESCGRLGTSIDLAATGGAKTSEAACGSWARCHWWEPAIQFTLVAELLALTRSIQ